MHFQPETMMSRKKIDQLLSKMTLEEKIGQINQQTGQGYSPEMVQIVKAGGIGSILNEVDPVVVNKLQKEAMKTAVCISR